MSDVGPLADGVMGAASLTPVPVEVDSSLKPVITNLVGHLVKSGVLDAIVTVIVFRQPGYGTLWPTFLVVKRAAKIRRGCAV